MKLSCMTDLWIFEQLLPNEKKQIHNMVKRLNYRRGDYLFLEGEKASMIFLITSGRVKLCKVSEEGKEITLGYLTSHDILGEEILFTDSLRTFSAQALEPTGICACLKKDFELLIDQNSTISRKLIQTMGQKLTRITEQLSDVATHTTRERVSRTLVRLAKDYGEITDNGRRINFRLTHEELGSLVGASRVMVTNVLKSLAESDRTITRDSRQRFIVSNNLIAEVEKEVEAQVLPIGPPCPCFDEFLKI